MVNYRDARLDRTFSAMAHPIRRGILERLAAGEAAVSELAHPFKVSAPAISKHLHILENAGLLVRRRQGREHRCRLDARKMRQAEDWIEHYRNSWEKRLDRLENYLKEMQAKENSHGRSKKQAR